MMNKEKIYFILLKSNRNISDENGLNLLLQNVHDKNTQNKITGRLLVSDQKFMQYFEGHEQVILELFTRISQDNRNNAIKVISFGTTDFRLFDDFICTLPILNKKDLDFTKTLNPNINNLSEDSIFSQHVHIINEYLKEFYYDGDVDYRKFWTGNSLKMSN